jgi:hypothetical protein
LHLKGHSNAAFKNVCRSSEEIEAVSKEIIDIKEKCEAKADFIARFHPAMHKLLQ